MYTEALFNKIMENYFSKHQMKNLNKHKNQHILAAETSTKH